MNSIPIQQSDIRVPTFDVMSSRHWDNKKITESDNNHSSFAETISTDIYPYKQNSPTSPFKIGLEPIKATQSIFESPARSLVRVPQTERTYSVYSPIKEILKENNGICREGYLTEADKLLERGYLIVEERVEEKKSLTLQKASLEKNLMKVQKDILPEMKKNKELQEQLDVCKGIKAKHIKDIQNLDNEILKYKNLIKFTIEENQRKEQNLLKEIGQIDQDVDEVRKDTIRSRMKGREKVQTLEKKVVEVEEEKKTLEEELSYLKMRLAETKKQHVHKKNILDEKARTFVGILQCK